jgi:hypothetical protein
MARAECPQAALGSRAVPWRQATAFLLRFALLYAALSAVWPAVGEAYGRDYAETGQRLFGSASRASAVRFGRIEPVGGLDIRIVFSNRSTSQTLSMLRSSRFTGYGLASLLAALVIATPLPWRRRLRALAWGLLFVHLFMALALGLLVLDMFSNGDALAVVHLPAPVKLLLDLATFHLSLFKTAPYVVCFLIWGLATFRRGDWETLLADPGQGSAPAHRAARRFRGRSDRPIRRH